ncbi:hypothetical protein JB92DRAFT_2836745 [Gautieria morchelliformis]|nr:hypothetical protein JB92DRAFT_2836745 [Gautieria morchelliformis]
MDSMDTSSSDDSEFAHGLDSNTPSEMGSDIEMVDSLNAEMAGILPRQIQMAGKSAKKSKGKKKIKSALKHKHLEIALEEPLSAKKNKHAEDDHEPLCENRGPEPIETEKKDAAGKPSSDRVYSCHDGSYKTTVTKLMKYSLNSLTGHLKNHHGSMNCLYLATKACSGLLTAEDSLLASSAKKLENRNLQEYVKNMTKGAEPLLASFARQEDLSKEPWDQHEFEQLLVNWIVICDQPFEENNGDM